MTNTNAPALILPAPPQGTNALASQDIRDIKPPLDIPTGWEWLWWTLGALAVAALAYWAWRRWRKKKETPVPVVLIPPHERARERLREALNLIDQPNPFCTLVSDTLRVYLEERFSLHAPERTTEEFLDELQDSALLSFEQKRSLGDFLVRCDLVKFARYEPGRPELQDLYEAALRLVDETAPPPMEPAVASAPGTGQPPLATAQSETADRQSPSP
ncbi:MAG: hypothetical protein HYZ36_01525 [Pedosphaera parvula]|nr:hypothetical protein [Verrucomicrobiota bacterium]MBI3191313.1 hypothetical protein [Pedosphaera parvula]